MDIIQAIQTRHSVRNYTDRPIEGDVLSRLQSEIQSCNQEGGLHIQLTKDEPGAFTTLMAHYGSFRNVRNYIALIGPKGTDLDEKIGYYGERIALAAQSLGLNTCWVALTFSKKKAKYILASGEKLVCVLAIGYGTTQGIPHKNKPMETLCKTEGPIPAWFQQGMEAAQLAPTAVNQQKFRFTLLKNSVKAEATGGVYSNVDLGIVKYHFEIGAGEERYRWK